MSRFPKRISGKGRGPKHPDFQTFVSDFRVFKDLRCFKGFFKNQGPLNLSQSARPKKKLFIQIE
jgi:hypothetical protein